jgi:hypothetical protein
MEQTQSDEAYRDGLSMCAVSSRDALSLASQEPTDDIDLHKMRCQCGKWWSYRNGNRLILRCKLCRRDIVVTGDNLKITYR